MLYFADIINNMKALCVLYGGRLESEAFEEIQPGGKCAFSLALEAAMRFPGIQKTVLLGVEGKNYSALPPGVEIVSRPSWTVKNLLEEISTLLPGFDFAYYAWADCPLLDFDLASSMAERHVRYLAEYSNADGWPYGLAPEIIAPETAGILAKLAENDFSPVERDALFRVIQKDINAFDIETEISSVDLRQYRLCLAADSKRNLLLLSRLFKDGVSSAAAAEKFVLEKGEELRTLPAFFNIQVTGACPQACALCPWPVYGGVGPGDVGPGGGQPGVQKPVTERTDFMPKESFALLLDKIAAFAGDAVVSISLWGEPSLHPEHGELIRLALERKEISLVIETSGIGWKEEELAALASSAQKAAPRKNHMAPLSWIVSLDAYDSQRYKEIRGPGFAEAVSCAKSLLALFPKDAYVQAVRVKDFEDDIENFYRSWKADDPDRVIIQKYDDFAGALPKLQATDLSPVKRRSCWHLQRDMNILLDGTVLRCREDLEALKGGGESPGNALREEISLIWERGAPLFNGHCRAVYPGSCALCDEYYTFNF